MESKIAEKEYTDNDVIFIDTETLSEEEMLTEDIYEEGEDE